MFPVNVTVNTAFAPPAVSVTVTLTIAILAASLSLMVAVAVVVLIVVVPVIPLSVAVNVSANSATLSLVIGTVNVCVAPETELAGKVKVPAAAVKSVPAVAVPLTVV